MKTTYILRSAVVLVAASIWVLPASGACNPPKSLSTYNFATGAYSYWHTTLYYGTLNAKIWSGGIDHTGTCNTFNTILYFGAAPGNFGFNFSLGDSCVTGCPGSSLSILASATNGLRSEVLIAQAEETAGAVNYDFSQTGSRALGDYPRPLVTSLSRVNNHITLTVAIPSIADYVFDGAGSGITGFNILGASATSDPGRVATPYTLLSFIPSPGGTGGTGTVAGDCPATGSADVWLVTQIVTTAGPATLVSQALRINCQILAEPKRKIDKRMGTHTEN